MSARPVESCCVLCFGFHTFRLPPPKCSFRINERKEIQCWDTRPHRIVFGLMTAAVAVYVTFLISWSTWFSPLSSLITGWALWARFDVLHHHMSSKFSWCHCDWRSYKVTWFYDFYIAGRKHFMPLKQQGKGISLLCCTPSHQTFSNKINWITKPVVVLKLA